MGNGNCKFVCRRCLSSYASQKVLIKHKQRFEGQEITSVRTSNVSHIYWKKHSHKSPICFRVYAFFETDEEIENSSKGNNTTNN